MIKYRRLTLEFYESDGHVQLRCTATPEQNNGEACVWTWRLAREYESEAVTQAIDHVMERHMQFIPYPE